MRTLGIDLAAQPADTAACLLVGSTSGCCSVAMLDSHVDDGQLLELMSQPDVARVGIDAPFGWPTDFLEALEHYQRAGAWPDVPGCDEHQARMRLRVTDRAVREAVGLTPLRRLSESS